MCHTPVSDTVSRWIEKSRYAFSFSHILNVFFNDYLTQADFF